MERGHKRAGTRFQKGLRARDVAKMLETLRERSLNSPESLAFLTRLIPVTRTFIFNSPEQLEDRTKKVVLG